MSGALVLGGGGVVGTAWMLGLAAAGWDGALDLGASGTVLGTSAGAVVGAVLALGLDPAEVAARPRTSHSDRTTAFRALLGTSDLPVRPLGVVVTDAETSEQQVIDGTSGWELPMAVAASTAYPGAFLPVVAHGRTWVDGGLASPTNAHLADGADGLLVVEPLAHLRPGPVPAGALHVVPDAGARRTFGRTVADLHDVGRWEAGFGAGRRQGIDLAREVARGRTDR